MSFFFNLSVICMVYSVGASKKTGIEVVLTSKNIWLDAQFENNPVIVSALKSHEFKDVLKSGMVNIYYGQLNISDALDLIRVVVQLNNFNHGNPPVANGPILEVMVSNGRDSLKIELPVIYNNGLSLNEDGKFLTPVLPEDFENKNRKKKNAVQNLIITVQSRVKEDIDFKISINRLDRSQYYVKFQKYQTSVTLNAHLTLTRPLGFFIDSVEQGITELLVEVKSVDDICATLITIPQNNSVYESRLKIYEDSAERVVTFSKRADIYFPNSELKDDPRFRIFIFVNPDDIKCDPNNSSRPSPSSRKKVKITFTKIESQSYLYPCLKMFAIFLLPFSFCITSLIISSMVKNTMRFSDNDDEELHVTTSNYANTQITFNEFEQSGGDLLVDVYANSVQSSNVELHNTDSFSMNSEVVKYPVAIIIPVFMHASLEYYKLKSSKIADEKCYHNFACAHPFLQIRALNNIVSNLGYFLFGLLFICVTVLKRKQTTRSINGLYECMLLDFTMGIFLMMQAIASVTYHICPSDVAFQFDSPFIQVICGLLVIRQWFIRYETPSPCVSNLLLVGILFLNFLISALSKTFYVRWVIGIIHVAITIILIKMKFKKHSHYSYAGIYSLIFFILNIFMVMVYTLYVQYIHVNQITTYCFIIYAASYLVFYTITKIKCGEKILLRSKIYGVLGILLWALSFFFYFNENSDWAKTTAQSRTLNKPCILFDFFGSHDVWHISSSFAILCTFFFVTTVDDNLNHVPKSAIIKF